MHVCGVPYWEGDACGAGMRAADPVHVVPDGDGAHLAGERRCMCVTPVLHSPVQADGTTSLHQVVSSNLRPVWRVCVCVCVCVYRHVAL